MELGQRTLDSEGFGIFKKYVINGFSFRNLNPARSSKDTSLK
jgi:hypothetical protein|tara:strand:+ start:463 stop:588 length:126 start_codon:yes stop_codon:yes gene_type:complete